MEIVARTEAETEALGARLFAALDPPATVLLDAPMGAGKTALARGFLRAGGVAGEVPSPTYALVQPYDTAKGAVFHLDLYRVEAPSELEELGLDDMTEAGIVLVEWPARAGGALTGDVRVSGRIAEDGARVWSVDGATL